MRTPFVDKSPHRRDSAAGRLKQRLARILTRSTCTTNNAAAASSGGTATATAFVSLAKTNNAHTAASSSHPEPEAPPSPYFCTPCTYDYERPKADRGTRPRRSRTRTRSASLVHISVDCTGGAASGRRSAHSDAPLLQHLLSEQVPARDVGGAKQSKGGGGRSKLTTARSSPSASRRHCSSSSSSSWGRARARRPSSTPTPYSWSSSSSSATATDDELAPFSGTDDEAGGEAADMRTLFSSLSFSSDPTSSEFYRTNGARSGNANRRSHRNTASRRRDRRARAPRRALSRAGGGESAAPPDAFRPLVSVETTRRTTERSERSNEDKGLNNAKKLTMTMLGAAAAAEEEAAAAGAGMAVVKRSSNPYLDFRSSMVEMVVERRIASVGKMEELLGSYLSLNSPRHHPAILAAFEDVWEAVFGEE